MDTKSTNKYCGKCHTYHLPPVGNVECTRRVEKNMAPKAIATRSVKTTETPETPKSIHSIGMKARWADPVFREKMRERQSEGAYKRWSANTQINTRNKADIGKVLDVKYKLPEGTWLNLSCTQKNFIQRRHRKGKMTTVALLESHSQFSNASK